MNSELEGNKQVAVTIVADPGTEFVVSDSSRIKIRSGAGSQGFQLPMGIYKARFMEGSRTRDELFEVGEAPVTLYAPQLEIASPVPLRGTSTSHEYHEGPARRLWKIPPVKHGSGSELAFLLRDSSKQWNAGSPSEPWRGLTLQGLGGATVLDFSSEGERDGNGGYAVARIELGPGTYLLTLERKSGPAMQLPITATPGWRTTVYLDCTGPDGLREPDIYGASVIIGAFEAEFLAEDPALRLAELAKLSIQKGRAAVNAAELAGMMSQKFTYPMLGILAAHVLLLASEPDVGTLRTVVGNLWKLMPQHPDVVALRVALDRFEPDKGLEDLRLSGPPMLRNGWDFLVQASMKLPQLLPAEATWMHYASGLSGSRVWLVWQRRPIADFPGAKAAKLRGISLDLTFFRRLAEATLWRRLRDRPLEEVVSALMDRARTVLAVEDGKLDRKRLAETWSSLRGALEDPSIAASPLENVLRRKILSILDDVEGDPDVATTLESLVRDFRVPAVTLIESAMLLYAAAEVRSRQELGK